MKKSLITFGLFTFFVLMVYGQEKKYALYSVAFYNLENLFDTIHDEGKNDYEYLPNGANQWNTMKYKAKLKNMAEVLSKLSTDKLPMGPAIIGVSEIENYRVLEDILKQPALADRGYKYIHHEGEDRRGVDCAFFYNPKLFELTGSKLLPYIYENDTVHKTRGFLIASGTIAGEKMHFIVNHWPSRAAASPARERAGVQVKAIKDSLLREDPTAKVVIMGDMNDDPMDKSMAVSLGTKRKQMDVGPTDLYNPWWDTLKKGYGTLMYRGKWNLFDQIVFTGNLLGTNRSTLKYYKHEIFRRDFMFQKDGKYKGYPKRTQAGGVWLNGYSDHLPSIIYLIKEVQ
jgi:hypothetical protein